MSCVYVNKLITPVLLVFILSACTVIGGTKKTIEGPLKEDRKDVQHGRTEVQLKAPDFGNKEDLRDIFESRLAVKRRTKGHLLTGHKKTLSVRGTPLKVVLFALFKGTPFGLSFGPGFEDKPVTVEFKDISLNDALDLLLSPLGLDYEIAGNTVVVGIPVLQTRFLRFDYPIADRSGTRSFSVTGFSGGSGGGGGGGSASITSSNEVNIWKEIGEALMTIIFGSTASGGVGSSGRINLADESGRKLITNPVTGTILVTASSLAIEEVEQFLSTVEASLKRQVLIEVVLLQVNLSDQFLFGLNLDYQLSSSSLQGIVAPFVTPPSFLAPDAFDPLSHSAAASRFSPDSGGFRLGVTGKNFSGLLDAIDQVGKVDILASPKIATLNNQQAVISVVTDEVFYRFEPSQVTIPQTGAPVVVEGGFTPERFTVGIILDVIAQISNDDTITLQIHPNISSIAGTATSPNGDTQPIIDRKELDTIIKVKSGETVVIGGLIDEKVTEDERGIPYLMDIPYLGNLFKRIEKRVQKKELMIFISPTILEGEALTRLTEKEQRRFKKIERREKRKR